MKQPIFESCFLDNDLVQRLKRIDVAAVSIASDGAMGTPGEVAVFFAGDDSIIEARGNYLYGNLDLESLIKKLHLDRRGPKVWTEHNLGMGNTLLVNAKDYNALDFNLNHYPDDIGEIYQLEIWRILSALHGIMDDLRTEIEAEEMELSKKYLMEHPQNDPSKALPAYDDEFWDDF